MQTETSETKETRHGKRRHGTVMLSFPVPESLKRDIRKLARADGHNVSEWLRIQLRNIARRSAAASKARTAS